VVLQVLAIASVAVKGDRIDAAAATFAMNIRDLMPTDSWEDASSTKRCSCDSGPPTQSRFYFADLGNLTADNIVSTIYILICVGLAVDYAAHIAHMFKESTGTPRERAIAAVERIGPCTFNAVFSTMLAVIVVGFSESYVFRIFFQVLFLVVTIAGLHGLWLLPVILSIVGGSKEPGPTTIENVQPEKDADTSSPEEPAQGA